MAEIAPCVWISARLRAARKPRPGVFLPEHSSPTRKSAHSARSLPLPAAGGAPSGDERAQVGGGRAVEGVAGLGGEALGEGGHPGAGVPGDAVGGPGRAAGSDGSGAPPAPWRPGRPGRTAAPRSRPAPRSRGSRWSLPGRRPARMTLDLHGARLTNRTPEPSASAARHPRRRHARSGAPRTGAAASRAGHSGGALPRPRRRGPSAGGLSAPPASPEATALGSSPG